MRPAGPLSARPCAERFIRTLEEQRLWVRTFSTVEELRRALLDWAHRYNEHWLLARHDFRSPSASSTPRTSSSNSRTSRLDMRKRPVHGAMKPVSRGPKVPSGTPVGNGAQRHVLQSAHQPVCSSYCVTSGTMHGNSTTCVTLSSGTNSRLCPLCPRRAWWSPPFSAQLPAQSSTIP